MEVWGAQGGNEDVIGLFKGGLGGFSMGECVLTYNSKIYVCVGGAGKANPNSSEKYIAGGYNGGGCILSEGYGTTGGGATHISRIDLGELKNFEENKIDVMIVAGGGGGSSCWHGSYYSGGTFYPNNTGYNGGSGGGDTGGISYGSSSTQSSPLIYYGGTQDSAGLGTIYYFPDDSEIHNNIGSFGVGGTGRGGLHNSGGGGGGWYGGTGGFDNSAGAGGSGHISSMVANGHMQSGVREGNGYCIITWQQLP